MVELIEGNMSLSVVVVAVLGDIVQSRSEELGICLGLSRD